MRERKSLEDHALQGTKPQYIAGGDVAPGRPKYPPNISGEAKKAFKRLSRSLINRNHATEGDQEILRMYAYLFDRYERARQHVADEGEIVPTNSVSKSGEVYEVLKPNQWLKVLQDAEAKMFACLQQLGLTPKTRSTVKPAKETPKPADQFPSREEATGVKPADPDADLLASIDETTVVAK
jgi:P27 family predicted phage terminase small subunit